MNLKMRKALIKILLIMNQKFCSINHISDMKWTEFKTKLMIWDCLELIKCLCLPVIIKYIYLKMDIVADHIFVNLLVDHIKIFIEYRKITLLFALCRTTILCSHILSHAIKKDSLRKQKIIKGKAKKFCLANIGKLEKILRKYYENLSEKWKTKKKKLS